MKSCHGDLEPVPRRLHRLRRLEAERRERAEMLAEPLPVTADSVAMSEPHEIEYTLRFGTPVPKTPEDAPAP